MTVRRDVVVLALALTTVNCGGPKPSSPAFQSLTGPYDLEIAVAGTCQLLFSSHRYTVEASSGSAGNTVTLASGDPGVRLAIVPGEGEAFTGQIEIADVVVGPNRYVLNVNGSIQGRLSVGGRPSVSNALLSGTLRGSDASGLSTPCQAPDHHWSLIPR